MLALLIALIGAVAVIGYAHSADARAVAGQKVAEVYIATKEVPQGTTAQKAESQGLITLQKVVAKGVPAGAMTSVPTSVQSLVALTPILAGEVVLTDRFGAQSAIRTTSGVPNGKVAITLPLSDPAGIKPLIDTGSHIVIYDTFNATGRTGRLTPYGAHLNDDKGTVRGTRVVLSDAEVLVVNKKTTGGTGSAGQQQADLLVTVAVSPTDATRLVHAIQTGTLYAGLLGSGATVAPGAQSSDLTVLGH